MVVFEGVNNEGCSHDSVAKREDVSQAPTTAKAHTNAVASTHPMARPGQTEHGPVRLANPYQQDTREAPHGAPRRRSGDGMCSDVV